MQNYKNTFWGFRDQSNTQLRSASGKNHPSVITSIGTSPSLSEVNDKFTAAPLTQDHSVKNLDFHSRMGMTARTQARFLNGNTRVTLPNAPGSLELVKCLGDLWGKGAIDGT